MLTITIITIIGLERGLGPPLGRGDRCLESDCETVVVAVVSSDWGEGLLGGEDARGKETSQLDIRAVGGFDYGLWKNETTAALRRVGSCNTGVEPVVLGRVVKGADCWCPELYYKDPICGGNSCLSSTINLLDKRRSCTGGRQRPHRPSYFPQ